MTRFEDHITNMYNTMLLESHEETVLDETFLVYEGYMYETYNKASIAAQYRPKITRVLTECGCIAIIAKGARGTPSRAVMLAHPSEVNIPDDAKVFRHAIPDETPKTIAGLSQSLNALERRVGDVDVPALARGVHAEIKNLSERLDKLESVL